jgi:predicted DNA binding CopG/RHH family protein
MNRKNNTRLYFRLPDPLKEMVRERAEEEGLTMSKYIRKIALRDIANSNTNQ